MTIIKRGSALHLKKRVPRRYGSVEAREFVYISLHTDSETVAATKAPKIWADLIEAWEARLAGDTTDADARFAAAKNLAQARGFRFMGAAEVAKLPLPDLMKRLDEVARTSKPGKPDLLAADAILGTVPLPALNLASSLDAFWKVARDKTLGKSPDQIRRWRNPYKKAVANFIDVLGRDKPIAEVTTDDLFLFREWWVDKLDAEGLTPNSANKDFIHLQKVMKTVAQSRGLKLSYANEGLALKQGEKRTRPPFSREWIVTKILAPGALDGLNLEARCLLLGMVNTGYRPSEGAMLDRTLIRLDAPVPHISIEPLGRSLKSRYARRKIPLLGVSLEAFRACPDGFPRYKDKAGLSATINKFLRENGLAETPGHTLYSLRHSFEDRMLAAGIDDRVRRDLFGHSLTRERYGAGASLEQARDLLGPVAL